MSISKRLLAAVAGISFWLTPSLQADNDCCDYYYEDCCEDYCGDCSRFWVDAEYLYWQLQDSPRVVPLVTEGSSLDDPDSCVVLGGRKLRNNWRSGGRFTVGYWFDDARCMGLEANYFFLPDETRKHSVCSDGSACSAFLGIPFFDVTTCKENSASIARPGHYSGRATLRVSNHMQGAELNALAAMPHTISCLCNADIGLLAGFRYWNFVENLRFDVSSPYVPPYPSDVYKTKDKFNAQNNFYGGQIGATMDFLWGCFSFNVKGKVALGAMCQTADIHGRFITNDFDGFAEPLTYPGGYFALPTNHGHHNKTRFSVIPEVNIGIGYEVTDCLRLQVGYTFLYASNVLWATKQVSSHINPTQSGAIEFTPSPELVGKRRPRASLKSDSLWVQGVNVGLEYKF